jgi:uncharacterized membrane protein YkvA (DUF1232 family)
VSANGTSNARGRRSRLAEKLEGLKRETLALYFAMKDPRTPIFAKICGCIVVAYALSPIDLIPDFIPIIGFLDDLVLVPLGIAICIRLIPREVLAEARVRASSAFERPTSRVAAGVVIAVWIAALLTLGWWVHGMFT